MPGIRTPCACAQDMKFAIASEGSSIAAEYLYKQAFIIAYSQAAMNLRVGNLNFSTPSDSNNLIVLHAVVEVLCG